MRQNLRTLRKKLDDAISVIGSALPSDLSRQLSRVHHGYDSANTEHRGFCGTAHIVINLCTFMHLSSSPDLFFELAKTVLHELAHFVDNNQSGHGPRWRHIYDGLTLLVWKATSAVPS